MKIIYKETIGDYTVIRTIASALVDSEQTKEKIAGLITPEMTEADVERLYAENAVYAHVGPEAELINDAAGEILQQKLEAKGKNQLLLESGEYLADYRGVEYWVKKSGKWKQEKIEEAGVNLPGGAVLQDKLTVEQNAEIAAQREAERIDALSAAQRAEEMRAKLHALAREANQKAEDADLLGEAFDKKAFFNSRKAEIEALYA